MTTAICIYGLPGSGKSTFVRIAEEYGLPTIVMGDVVREKAHEHLSEPITGQKIGEWATEQRNKHGKEIMAEYTVEQISEHSTDYIVVEGVRSKAELNVFAESMNTKQVYIKCPFEQRLQRLQDRNDDRAELSENGVTQSELRKRDEREKQWGMNELISNSKNHDVKIIDNTSSLSDYTEKIKSYLGDKVRT